MVTETQLSGQSGLPSVNPTKSFWHSEPSEFLLNHRTTPSLPSTADIIIIGSGIAGASAAHHLHSHETLKVVMLEAREACWGATGRNGGHCQPRLYGSSPEVVAFELRNYKAMKSLVETKNISCEWKSLVGCHAYMSKSMFEMAVSDVEMLQEQSPDLARLVTVVKKNSNSPSLADLRIPNAAGAILQAKAASLWPYKLVARVLEDLVQSNLLNLQTNTPATNLQKVEGGWIVHTARGMISAPKVLLCTNGYTSALVSQFEDLIVPVRGEMSSLVPPTAIRPTSSIYQPLDRSYAFIGHGSQSIQQDDYLVQRPFAVSSQIGGRSEDEGGELMFGGARSYAAGAGVGISDDSSIDEPAASYLRRELNIVLDIQNNEKELKATYEWSGIMGFSRDEYPWVGPANDSYDGLLICAGFTGHGMPNAWLCGAAASGLLLGKPRKELDLPERYFISRARILKARTLDEVWLADSKAFRG